MEVSYYLKGLLLGFSIAAPVGPIGVLCIKRTLTGGMMAGLISGLGTAIADTLYGLIAAFGITAVSSLLLKYTIYLRLCGGIFLLYLGYNLLRSRPATNPAQSLSSGNWGNFSSAFFLTLTNPLTILSFTAIFAGFGVGDTPGNYKLAAIMVGGVFSGSLLWWLLLSSLVGILRSRFDQRKLWIVNVASGITICFFGLVSLASLW
jgi:threonine/homoserine/homoserine lactone efflux protein